VSKPSKVLDIGAGDGAFLTQLLLRGYENLEGVEPSAAPLEAAHPEIRPHLRQDVFRADDYPPHSLGLATCFQTLEHVPDPLQLVRGVHRLLRSDGAFAIAVHNRRAWTAQILGRRSPIYDVEHLQLFCPRTAATLLARAGFRRIHVTTLRNRYPLRYWLRLFPLPTATKGRLLQVVGRNWLGRVNLSISAGNLFCWGRKE
jgi:SAM-dependent methyltransferase